MATTEILLRNGNLPNMSEFRIVNYPPIITPENIVDKPTIVLATELAQVPYHLGVLPGRNRPAYARFDLRGPSKTAQPPQKTTLILPTFKFEEGSVAVLPQLVAMEVTELRDLLRVPPLRPTLAKITENVSESAIQHHLVHCCLSDRGRFTSRQLEAVDSAPENPTTLERLGSIGSTDDNIREEPAEVNIHAHDPLESIRNHLRIPNAIHDHFTNRGPEPEETFKNVSFPVVAHDFLL